MAARALSESSYVHGTSAVEQRRLALLNGILNEGSLRQIDLRGGERVLDVGCGLAHLTYAMARAVLPDGRVIGVERSAEQLGAARAHGQAGEEVHLVELRQGNALELPLRDEEWGSFDVAHARFLLEHVSDPLAVVRGMVRAVRPGGRVVLEDDDHELLHLWPEPPGFRTIWEAYVRSYDRLGNDPYVGRRLVSLLHQAGAEPRRNTWLFFGSCAGNPDLDACMANLSGILSGVKGQLVADNLVDEPYFDRALQALEEWKGRKDAALWFGLPWAEGIRPC